MNELIRQFLDLLQTRVITLGEEPVKVIQVVWLIATLAVTLTIAGFLRRWFRRLFGKLGMPQNLKDRLLALLFLVTLIFGVGLAFRFAGISTGFFGKLFDYPLTDLFQPPRKSEETEAAGDVAKLTLARLFYGFVIVFGMFILSKYVQWVLRRQVLQAFHIAEHTQFILLRFLHFSLIIVGVIISLSTVGVSFTSLALIFGGLSIGVGFGLQNIASNLIAGFILIFERPIKIGDLVEIMDVNIFGRVGSINLRSTVIIALDEKEIIVPNSQLITESVHNLTHDNLWFRLRIQVGVSYSSDVETVKKALLEVAHAHPDIIKEPNPEIPNITAPFIRFTDFGNSSLNFELLAWIPDCFQRFDIASDLHFMIWEKFKEYNIKIPFPQRDVHFYPTDTERQSGG
ncbi:mechanosensitive ion channel [Candidatus Poribacteria bacterium]|nr:mechanosensitive ion channel [Candidatus Poribacteria bacterium]